MKKTQTKVYDTKKAQTKVYATDRCHPECSAVYLLFGLRQDVLNRGECFFVAASELGEANAG